MRAHPQDFRPFVLQEDVAGGEGGGGGADGGGAEEGGADAYEAYCSEVETTAAWGGQVEAQALAGALGVHIQVYSVGLPLVEMGQEHSGACTQGLGTWVPWLAGWVSLRAELEEAAEAGPAAASSAVQLRCFDLAGLCTWCAAGDGARTLRVCYLRHAYGLGEHYNAIVPRDAGEEEEEEDEAAGAGGSDVEEEED